MASYRAYSSRSTPGASYGRAGSWSRSGVRQRSRSTCGRRRADNVVNRLLRWDSSNGLARHGPGRSAATVDEVDRCMTDVAPEVVELDVTFRRSTPGPAGEPSAAELRRGAGRPTAAGTCARARRRARRMPSARHAAAARTCPSCVPHLRPAGRGGRRRRPGGAVPEPLVPAAAVRRVLAGRLDTATRNVLVRNYDYPPLLCDTTVLRRSWNGTPVMAMSDCVLGRARRRQRPRPVRGDRLRRVARWSATASGSGWSSATSSSSRRDVPEAVDDAASGSRSSWPTTSRWSTRRAQRRSSTSRPTGP